jgi:membrane associated rhomboid family serine protease
MQENDNSEYEPSEEDFLPEMPPPPSPLARSPYLRRTVPVILFIYASWMLSYLFWGGYTSDLYSLSFNAVVHLHEFWRVPASVLMHKGPAHFASNMLAAAFAGWLLYDYFGTLLFPAAAFVCGMAANFTAVCSYGGDVRLIGASGMVYAMAALWLVMYVRFDTERRTAVKIFRALAFSLAMLFPTTFSLEVSYTAHATGFAYGIFAGIVCAFFARVRE